MCGTFAVTHYSHVLSWADHADLPAETGAVSESTVCSQAPLAIKQN